MSVYDETFEKLEELQGNKYDYCCFKDSAFDGADFSSKEFIECRFENCNLSNIKLNGTGLKDVEFINCKMIGLDFSGSQDFLFSVRFKSCNLDYCVFAKKKLTKTKFEDCSLKSASFEETNLKEASFDKCNLENAVFYRTDLTSADLRTAYSYTISPTNNLLRKAKFSYPEVLSLLDEFKVDVK